MRALRGGQRSLRITEVHLQVAAERREDGKTGRREGGPTGWYIVIPDVPSGMPAMCLGT